MSMDLPQEPVPVLMRPARPRIWTVFVTLVFALLGTGILQGVGAVVYAIATGMDLAQISTELPGLLKTPGGFLVLMGLGQAAFAATVLAAGLLSPVPFKIRLAFLPTTLSTTAYTAIAVGSVVPLAIGVACGQLLARLTAVAGFTDVDQLAGGLYEQMTGGIAIAFILFIAFVPAFTEEALFRGYMQRRLLERWRPWVAITVVSILFAAMHGTIQWAVQVLPLGVWLGIVAWRTGSIWPGIVCHAFINGSRNIWGVIAEFAGISEQAQIIALIGVLLVCLGAFVLAIRILSSYSNPAAAVANYAEPNDNLRVNWNEPAPFDSGPTYEDRT